MTNTDKMNEQLSQLADIVKKMFTEEELKEMEYSFDIFKQLDETDSNATNE